MAATNYRDKRFRKVQGGPVILTNAGSSSTNQWFGETVITSRHEYVGAPLVASTSRIALDVKWLGHTNSMALGYSFLTTSIQAGSGFYISATNSLAFAGTSTPSLAVQWEIRNPR
jgi:hypothetical protein